MPVSASEKFLPHLLENSHTGSSVALVGMQHVAYDESYYRAAELYLNEREAAGSAIHYELCREASPQAVRGAPKVVQRKHRLLQEYFRYTTEAIDVLNDAGVGLSKLYQYEEIAIQPSWENHDFTTLDLARALSGPMLNALQGQALNEHWYAVTWGTPTRQQLFDVFTPKLHAEWDDVFIVQRNAFALKAVRAALQDKPSQDLTLLWGREHLPGLSKGLEKMGYRLLEPAGMA